MSVVFGIVRNGISSRRMMDAWVVWTGSGGRRWTRTKDAWMHIAWSVVSMLDVGLFHMILLYLECRQPSSSLVSQIPQHRNSPGIVENLEVSRSVSPASGSKWGKSYCGSEKISGPRRTQFLQPRTGQGLRVRHRGPITILQVNPGPKSYPIDQSTSPAVILRTGARIAAAFPCCDRALFCPLPSALCARRCGPAKAALG